MTLTIAHLDAEKGFSGGEVQVFLLLEGLRQRGHRNVVFCQPGSPVEAECIKRGFEVHSVRMRNKFDLGAIRRLGRGFRNCGAELVQANTGRDTWLGGWAAYRVGLPAVTTRRMERRVRKGFETRWIYTKLFGRVAAISPAVAECLREGGVPEPRIVLIPDAVDPARVAPSQDRVAVREALNVEPQQILVLALGALVKRKGFDVLLEALSRIETGQPGRIQLRIGGDGPEREALENDIRRLRLGEQVSLLGRREDVGDLLSACDVFAMPSRAEGLGVAAIEAMAAGRPVIASRTGGLAFAVIPDETGLLVTPEDPVMLADALRRLAADGALREQMGAGGKRRAEQEFHGDQLVEAYLDVYREVLTDR